MAKTFIDVSEEAKERVLGSLSSGPDSSMWRNFVDSGDALSAMHLAHPLSGVARMTFTKVAVNCVT